MAAAVQQFQLVLIKPEGFDFVESFREVIEALQESLHELGHGVSLETNHILPTATPIIFGAHHLSAADAGLLPPTAIIFNLEQLRPGYPWFSEAYLQLLSRFQVWDYDAQNVAFLRDSGVSPAAQLLPIGYSPCLTRIAPGATEDIDVLFFGLLSERRRQVLQEIEQLGLKVIALTNVWGHERDAWIARAKVVLNLHFREGGRFEAVRVMFLLANGKAVVSENSEDISEAYRQAIITASYAELAECCRQLVNDPATRTALCTRAQEIIHNPVLSMSAGLAQTLAASHSA